MSRLGSRSRSRRRDDDPCALGVPCRRVWDRGWGVTDRCCGLRRRLVPFARTWPSAWPLPAPWPLPGSLPEVWMPGDAPPLRERGPPRGVERLSPSAGATLPPPSLPRRRACPGACSSLSNSRAARLRRAVVSSRLWRSLPSDAAVTANDGEAGVNVAPAAAADGDGGGGGADTDPWRSAGDADRARRRDRFSRACARARVRRMNSERDGVAGDAT